MGEDAAESPDEEPETTEPAEDPANQEGELVEAPEDPQARIVELEEQVQQLGDRAEELEDEVAHRTNQLARVQADFENYRKRMKREKAEMRDEARLEMVRTLVDVLDDLERAQAAADPEDKVAEGVGMVLKRISTVLEDHEVERLAPEPGDGLDPDVHEALLTEASDEVEAGRVLETVQVGYRMGHRLVRPALVKVAE